MRKEIFEIVQGMDLTDIETQLALQCAPLIVGLKMSNLLIIENNNLYEVTKILKDSSISCFALSENAERSMLLLYNVEKLTAYLLEDNVKRFLEECGYKEISLMEIFEVFRFRYQKYESDNEKFPHEMGVLLGYPIEDVEGFIENEGKNFLYAGYWKVYANLSLKIQLFRKFEAAKETLIQLVSIGLSITDIIRFYSNREWKMAVV